MSAIQINFVNFAPIIKDSHLIKKKINMVNHNVNHKTKELINSLKNKDKIKILFVCLGNICRSPAAEGVMRAVVEAEEGQKVPEMSWGEPEVPSEATARWIIDSAGTGNYHIGDLPDRRMRIHARDRGYNLTHRCRQVTEEDFERFDLIIGMDAQNLMNLKRLAPTPEAEEKIVAMAEFVGPTFHADYVPDPYYEGSEGFELVLDLLEDGCRNLYDELTENN